MLLLQSYFFYASGHETTFTHIKWESGFHGFDGDNNNHLIRLVMAIFILLNTFCSQVLIANCCLNLLNLTVRRKSTATRSDLISVQNNLSYFRLFSTKILLSAISVFALRRHLMVWKIFAPRFLIESIGFIVTCLLSLIVYK